MGSSVAEIHVTRYVRDVTASSGSVGPDPASARNVNDAVAHAALRARLVDDVLGRLFRDGVLAEHRPVRGHEAALVAAAAALGAGDWFFGEGDEIVVALERGVPLVAVVAHLLGAARSPLDDRQRHLVASGWRNAAHLTHAAGFAWGARIASARAVALASFREQTIDAGEFHNAINFAGVFKAPVVFLCRSWEGAAEARGDVSPAERGVAYGVRSVVCDAGDAGDVVGAVSAAVERARAGEGTTLIEARARKDAPQPVADPALAHAVDAEIAAALAEAERTAPAPRTALFENTFGEPAWNLREQEERGT